MSYQNKCFWHYKKVLPALLGESWSPSMTYLDISDGLVGLEGHDVRLLSTDVQLHVDNLRANTKNNNNISI